MMVICGETQVHVVKANKAEDNQFSKLADRWIVLGLLILVSGQPFQAFRKLFDCKHWPVSTVVFAGFLRSSRRYIFGWRSRWRRCRPCLSSLLWVEDPAIFRIVGKMFHSETTTTTTDTIEANVTQCVACSNRRPYFTYLCGNYKEFQQGRRLWQ